MRKAFRKKTENAYNENVTKEGGGVSDMNHYLKLLWNSEKVTTIHYYFFSRSSDLTTTRYCGNFAQF